MLWSEKALATKWLDVLSGFRLESEGGYLGWIVTTGGTPGTFKTFGAITP